MLEEALTKEKVVSGMVCGRITILGLPCDSTRPGIVPLYDVVTVHTQYKDGEALRQVEG